MKCDVCGAEPIDNGPCPACTPRHQPQPAASGAHPAPDSPTGGAPTEFGPAGTVPAGFAPIGSGVAATGPVAAGPAAPAGGYTVRHSGGYAMPAFPFRPLRWPATIAVAGIGVGEGVHLLGLTLTAMGRPAYPYGQVSRIGVLL